MNNSIGNTHGRDNKIFIIGLNSFINTVKNDGRFTKKHIVCTSGDFFGKSYFNQTKTTEGGYYNSYINQTTIGLPTNSPDIGGTINQQLLAEFGNHLQTTMERLSDYVKLDSDFNRLPEESVYVSYNNYMKGTVSGSHTYEMQAILFSEKELFGSSTFSSSAFDDNESNSIFPAMLYSKFRSNRLAGYFLRNIASKGCVSFIHNSNYIGLSFADELFSVRVRFVLG